MTTAERLPLSRDRIIAAAVELVDRAGSRCPEHAQARRGARRRGHVALQPHREQGRRARRHAATRSWARSASPAPDGRLGRAAARRWPTRSAGSASSTPGCCRCSAPARSLTAEGFAPVEAMHQTLVDAGFATERGMHAFVFVAAFVLGYLRIDLGRLTPAPGDPSGPYDTWRGSQHEPAAQFGQSLVGARLGRRVRAVPRPGDRVPGGAGRLGRRPGRARRDRSAGPGGRSRSGR